MLEVGSKNRRMGMGGDISWVLLRVERAGQGGGGPAAEAGSEVSCVCPGS
jgi:hypothetical protein